ncbi:hypothetical protein [Roseovarius aquimarinus]|uniref:SGNH/GDSL hydrolase family protein n=1 Tax=Roseovarius aquimarinus TaxID=1229156 RepID=A0ABW7I4Y3_9RHOB
MGKRMMIWLGAGAVLLAGAAALWAMRAAPVSPEAFAAAHAAPSVPPEAGMRVYHLGHSLVGRDMPAMLEQLAPAPHAYMSQLGWGTSLREHWEPDLPINGFEAENDHPRFAPAREAISSGTYDAVILTEMVEIEDAIRHHASAKYLAEWAGLARQADPGTRLYLYETWHRLDDEAGWLERLGRDLQGAWVSRLLRPAHTADAPPIRLIPAGQVMAALVRRVEAAGGIGPMTDRTDLFRLAEDGSQDMIHPSDLGNYLVALTHYAVLYHRSPVGLPHALARADGSPADEPGPELARVMQETVWDVVSAMPMTGVAP